MEEDTGRVQNAFLEGISIKTIKLPYIEDNTYPTAAPTDAMMNEKRLLHSCLSSSAILFVFSLLIFIDCNRGEMGSQMQIREI